MNPVSMASRPVMRRRGAQALAAFALSLGMSAAWAAAVFDQPDPDFNGRVTVQGAGAIYPGTELTVVGQSFKPGQQVTLQRGNTVLNPDGPYVADEKGRFETKWTVPADAVIGRHPIIISVANPSAAVVVPLKISPKVPLSGENRFETKTEPLAPGLYQSAYSPKSDKLFVTGAVGRPPVRQSELLKVDPASLKIEARVSPGAVPSRQDGHLYAVYGVGVDDANGNVWTTNTRDNTVAVYRQSDLGLVKQFEPGLVGHGRDVVIASKAGKAYASSVGGSIEVFDTKSLAHSKTITIDSGLREKFSPMSLVLDVDGQKLYTVSLSTPQAAEIDIATDTVTRLIPLPGAISPSGVAVDPKTNRLFVASQGTDTLQIVDLADGKVLHEVATGAGALNVAFDDVARLAYVSNRGAGTVTIVDPDGKIVANLDGGTLPNHVAVDGKGNAYLVNKSRGRDDAQGDAITRLTPRK